MDTELLRTAPKLKWDNKDKLRNKNGLYELMPKEICILGRRKLTGNAYKLLSALVGISSASSDFRVTEAWVYNETGLASTCYYRARKELIEFGYITFKKNQEIKINFTKMYHDYDTINWNEGLPSYISKSKERAIKQAAKELKAPKNNTEDNDDEDFVEYKSKSESMRPNSEAKASKTKTSDTKISDEEYDDFIENGDW